LNGLLM